MSDHVYVIDTETTGFKDPVLPIQFAALRIKGKTPAKAEPADFVEFLFNPGKKIEYGAMATHGITHADVAGREPWNGWQWRATPEYLIGHSVKYDYDVIKPALSLSSVVPNLIDTAGLSRIAWPELDSHKLAACCHYIVDQRLTSDPDALYRYLKNAHDAQADVMMAWCVIQAIIKATKIKSWENLHALSMLATVPTTMPLGKYRGDKIRDVPPDYKSWALGPKGITDLDPGLRRALEMKKQDWAMQDEAIKTLLGK